MSQRWASILLTISGPALGAPKGIGALYFRNKLRLVPQLNGGIQENGRRGGTENIPGIVGLGKAAELALGELDEKAGYLAKLRDLLIAGVRKNVREVLLTGHPDKRLPGHASFCFEGIEGEALIFRLSSRGIMERRFALRLQGPEDLAGPGRHRHQAGSGPGLPRSSPLNRETGRKRCIMSCSTCLRPSKIRALSPGLAAENGRGR